MEHRRRITGRCLYCGACLRSGRRMACAGHTDLPALDPYYRVETVRPLEHAPDLPLREAA